MRHQQYLNAQQIKSALANSPQLTFEVADASSPRCEYCAYGRTFIDYMATLWDSINSHW